MRVRRTAFLVSLLFHLVGGFLLLRMPMNVRQVPVRFSEIAVVPRSPPLEAPPPPPAQPQPPVVPQARRPLSVRPFVIPPGSGGEAGAPPPAAESAAVPPAESSPEISASPPEGEMATPPRREEAAPRKGLVIDQRAIAQKLRDRDAKAAPALREEPAGIPFNREVPGLSGRGTGDGTPTTAGAAFFDAKGYDITPWAQRALYRVKRNWIVPPSSRVGLSGTVGIFLIIERDGHFREPKIRNSSGIAPFDQAAWNALVLSIPFPELPGDFPNPDLPAYFVFRYN